jgi:hypothetical protein
MGLFDCSDKISALREKIKILETKLQSQTELKNMMRDAVTTKPVPPQQYQNEYDVPPRPPLVSSRGGRRTRKRINKRRKHRSRRRN